MERGPLEVSLPLRLPLSLFDVEAGSGVRAMSFSTLCAFSLGAFPSNRLFNLSASSSKSTYTLAASTGSVVMPDTTLDLGGTWREAGDSSDGEVEPVRVRFVKFSGLSARRDRLRAVDGETVSVFVERTQ